MMSSWSFGSALGLDLMDPLDGQILTPSFHRFIHCSLNGNSLEKVASNI
jgi:hypothetical protein